MVRRPPRSTRTDTLFPYTTLFRSCLPLDSLVRTLGSTASAPCGLGRSRHLPIRIGPGRVSHNRPKGRARKVRGRQIGGCKIGGARSEEHTSELQSLMRISYAVFRLQKQKKA